MWARILVRDNWKALTSSTPTQFYIPDSGFLDETLELATAVSKANITVARLHRTGRTFDGDSRYYVEAEKYGINTLDITNEDNNLESMVSVVDRHYFGGLLR